MHLLAYDTNYGPAGFTPVVEGDTVHVGDWKIKSLAERDPKLLPWGELGVDVVVESTGIFRTGTQAGVHRNNGAKKVIITAPTKEEDLTIVLGVNQDQYDPAKHHIVSNASCTTNCLAPVALVVHKAFGIKSGVMTTVHAYTNDQRILDLPHKDLRRARAAACNIIPTVVEAHAIFCGDVVPKELPLADMFTRFCHKGNVLWVFFPSPFCGKAYCFMRFYRYFLGKGKISRPKNAAVAPGEYISRVSLLSKYGLTGDELEAAAFAECVAKGDLEQCIPVGASRNEIGVLCLCLNMMTTNLRERIEEGVRSLEQANMKEKEATEAMRKVDAAGQEASKKSKDLLLAADHLENVANVVAAAAAKLGNQLAGAENNASLQAARINETTIA
ncbi:hypothetical protein B566_EDAN018958, partial [Ephemera danica]